MTSCCIFGRIISRKMIFIIILFFIIYVLLKKWLAYKRYLSKQNKDNITVAFFHPYCNAGGGGERVLWTAIRALQNKYAHLQCIVYTGDLTVTEEDIMKKAKTQFKITFPRDIKFVFLKKRYLVEAKLYPHFTLLLQSLGSIVLGLEALFKFVPDVYIDSMGYAFTLPIFKYLGNCQTSCYVHYPTISTDMLEAVAQRKVGVNNSRLISKSHFLSSFKIFYYKAFAYLYGIMGRRADIIMVNSTWTKGHILSLWKSPSKTVLVYPPCDISEFERIPLSTAHKSHRILSIAQFRPEKDHELQIRAFHELLNKLSSQDRKEITLVLIGGCRSTEDWERVEKLKLLCRNLELDEYVEFSVNLPFEKLVLEMQNADIALHTMWNEHFGIGIVECMSAGLMVIAHNSGGPKLDIVVEFNGKRTGFLADDISSYCTAMELVLKMPEEERLELLENARDSARRFSVENFENSFLQATSVLFL